MSTVPNIPTFIPSSGTASTAATPDHIAHSDGGRSAFAGAMDAAGSQPGLRSGASKAADDEGSGGRLPPAGNQSPSVAAAAPPPAMAPSRAGGNAAHRPRAERSKASSSAADSNPAAPGAASAADDPIGLAAAAAAATQAAAGAAPPTDTATPATGVAAMNGELVDAARGSPAAAGNSSRFAAMSAAPVAGVAGGKAGAAAPNAAFQSNFSRTIESTAPPNPTTGTAAAGATTAAGASTAAGTTLSAGAAVDITIAGATTLTGAAKTLGASTAAGAAAVSDSTAAARAASDATPVDGGAAGVGAITADPFTGRAPASTISVAPAASADQAGAASAAATRSGARLSKPAAKPMQAAVGPRPSPFARAVAPDSGAAAATGGSGETDSTFSKASTSTDAGAPAEDDTKVSAAPAAAGTVPLDSSVTATAVAAAGAAQPAAVQKAGTEKSYHSDASVDALRADAAAPVLPGRSGLHAAGAPAPGSNTPPAPIIADGARHAHAGFDLAALTGSNGDAAAGLSQLNPVASASAPADAAPATALRIHASIDSGDFPQGLSDRVAWMVDNGVNGAKLQVNPPQLGPIELRISVQGDHAQVWMSTHSTVARDALESGSPKLREMLNAQGFGQVSVDISQRSFQDRSAYAPPYQRESAPPSAVAAAQAAVTSTGTSPRSQLGALDAYA